jgi:hypothetical protein
MKEAAQAREAEEDSIRGLLRGLLEKLKNAAPDTLNLRFSQLEIVIHNYLLFPTLKESYIDTETYLLREELYMLSFWHPRIQAGIQTRILATLLATPNTSASSSKSQNNPMAAASMLAASVGLSRMGKMNETLDEIAEDTEGVGDFFEG